MIQLKHTKNWEITQDHPRTGQPRTARTSKNINAVLETIKWNPQRTINEMAESLEIHVSPYSMISIVKKDAINLLEILSPALIEMKSKWKNEVFSFQHDGAPSHTSTKIQSWCRWNFPLFWDKEMWPPSSPDINRCLSEKLSVKAWADIPEKKTYVL